jgi:hypothetical protein
MYPICNIQCVGRGEEAEKMICKEEKGNKIEAPGEKETGKDCEHTDNEKAKKENKKFWEELIAYIP